MGNWTNGAKLAQQRINCRGKSEPTNRALRAPLFSRVNSHVCTGRSFVLYFFLIIFYTFIILSLANFIGQYFINYNQLISTLHRNVKI